MNRSLHTHTEREREKELGGAEPNRHAGGGRNESKREKEREIKGLFGL